MILGPCHETLVARDGSQALDLLRSRPVDLVTLDLNMPGLKGEPLMRRIRRQFPDVEVIVITGCPTLASATEGLRAGISDYLSKPFDVIQVRVAVERALGRRNGARRIHGFLGALGDLVGRDQRVCTLFERVEASPLLRQQVGELMSAAEAGAVGPAAAAPPVRTFEFLEVLAETIESQDPFLRGHARRVAAGAELLANHLCLPAAQCEHVRVSAFLHDLGKIGVPTHLLMRPEALRPEEHQLVQRHPEIGERLVQPLGIAPEVSAAIRHHHEWWDGRGYPDGLAAEEIPLAARIVAVADAFDAMSCGRPYRAALTAEAASRELRLCAGSQFDPRLAEEFVCVLASRSSDLADRGMGGSDLLTSVLPHEEHPSTQWMEVME
jgi:response regulator RpfG family c-di-GMP phosphodiesterase